MSAPPLQELPDQALAGLCRDGNQAAWSTLVHRFQSLIYTVPRRAGLGEAEAADVFQTTFARLVEHLARIDDLSRVRAWLVTTAKRETLRRLERRRRIGTLPSTAGNESGDDWPDPFDQLPDPAPLQEQALSDLQDLHRLRQAVQRLEPRMQQFVELLFLQDEALPYSEIARRLGMAEGSIGPTRARCLEKLRGLLATL